MARNSFTNTLFPCVHGKRYDGATPVGVVDDMSRAAFGGGTLHLIDCVPGTQKLKNNVRPQVTDGRLFGFFPDDV